MKKTERIRNVKLKELGKYTELKNEINQLKDELEELEQRAEYTSVVVTGMPGGSGKSDKIAVLVSNIVDLKKRLLDKILYAMDEYNKINDFISNIDDAHVRTIMRYRHIQEYSWDEIAKKMAYSAGSLRNRYYKFLKEELNYTDSD